MGKYTSSSRQQGPTRDRTPPLMRGIGCILFVVVPFFAYGVAMWLADYGARKGWPIPQSWYGAPTLPAFIAGLPGLAGLANFLRGQQNLTVNLILALLITVVIYGLMSIIYGYVYALAGPSRYGPMDVPPPRVKTKKFKR